MLGCGQEIDTKQEDIISDENIILDDIDDEPEIPIIESIKKDDISVCDLEENVKFRDKCRVNYILTKALEEEDVSICEQLEGKMVEECRFNVIINLAVTNPIACEQLTGNYRENCLMFTAMGGEI